MQVRSCLVLLAILAVIVLGSCAPAVPYGQMPGGQDLYSGAQNNRQLAEQALREAELMEAAMSATAQAPIVHITETAAAIVVQQAQAAGTGTAAIQTQAGAMTATAVWWTPTPNFDSTSTVAALNANNTAIANAAARDQLQLQREIQNNEWNRLSGPMMLIFAATLIVVLLIHYMRRTRYQPVQMDARGNVLPVIDIVDGMATDIDRNPNHQGSVSRDLLIRLLAHIVEQRFGVRPQLPEITAARQDATTERDQMIDLATRGLPGPSSEHREMKKLAGQQMMKQVSETNLASRFRVLDGPNNNVDAVDGQVIQALDNDWKEAVKK